MKKLLSLLSVLTISGTAVPTTIAASPYQKEEIKLENSEINYQQTNNLESLNRFKRNINQINNLIDEIKNIKFNGIKKILYNVDNKNISKLPTRIFSWENMIYFIFETDGGIYYEYNPSTKNTVRTQTNHNVYSYVEGMGNTLKNINNEYPILNNKKYIILNGKVYEEDRANHEQKIVLEDIYKNPDGSTISLSDFRINGIVLNNKIYFISDNGTLFEYWPFESMLKQDESLINWKKLFNDWRNNMDFDFKNNFTSKSETEKKSWIDNKKHELLVKIDNFKDKINIIKNRENIEQLKIQFSSLEQKIDNLRIKIDNLLNNSSNSSNLLTMCNNLTSLMSAGTSVVPVVGSVISAAFGIISAGCSIANT